MNVAVLGLWHLGSVTAACAAAAGHQVAAWDPDPAVVDALMRGTPPIHEPGLPQLVEAGLGTGTLHFHHDLAAAVSDADVVWTTFDTPVDQDDRADVQSVLDRIVVAFPHVRDGAVVLTSSQLPVGSVARLEREWERVANGRRAGFACSPENLRLGKAIEVFRTPDRVVIGVRSAEDRARLEALFEPITDRLEWMSVESAEMTKHAINAFLATSVTFINEVASLCEQTGADAKEVERGLKTERRIGPLAYLSPGAAFAGGTLARDVVFLRDLGQRVDRPTPLMDGVEASNRSHREWARRRLSAELGSLAGKNIGVWGLTYKPGTDTLRRSSAVELCRWLVQQGAVVRVHDPAVRALPDDLATARRVEAPLEAVIGAAALVVATEWPVYRTVTGDELAAAMTNPLIVDANRFLGPSIGADARFRLLSVGKGDR
jgi:UDPglucose 6-dehydrogenase